ncbi:MAG: ComEC/Rec2 family competence protein [Bacteroidaceae bacterium]|nr:ComEC/Rec2 family competence protein [Bacteroidaceae bacterium]
MELEKYPALRILVPFVAGIFVSDSVLQFLGNSHYAVLAISVVLLICLAWLHWRDCRRPVPWRFGAVTFLAFLVLGVEVSDLWGSKDNIVFPQEKCSYSGVVDDYPVAKRRSYLVKTRLENNKFVYVYLPRKDSARISSLAPGDSIMFASRLSRPVNYSPGFDYARWLRRKGVVATGYAHRWEAKPAGDIRLSHRFLRIRHSIVASIPDSLFSDEDNAVLVALTLGEKSMLDEGVRRDYSNAGASHVLALSGLHLSIVYGVLLFLFGADVRRPRWRAFVQIPILIIVWSYVLLAACPLSLLRAAIMATFFSVGIMLGKGGNALNTLSLSAFAILLFSPDSLFDVGFQLSYAAVYSILLLFQPLYALLKFRFAVLRYAWGLVCVSVVAQVGVAPLVVLYFGNVSLSFVVTNLVVIPLVTIIVWAALAYYASLACVSVLSVYVAKGLSVLLTALNESVRLISSVSYSYISNLTVSGIDVIGYYVAVLLCIAAFRSHRAKRLMLLQVAVVVLLGFHLLATFY